MYQIDYLTLTVTEGYPIELDCFLLVGTENGEKINWKWYFNGNAIVVNTTITNSNSQSKLIISSLTLSDRGNYSCTASNSFGNYSRSISIKVKSKIINLQILIYLISQLI